MTDPVLQSRRFRLEYIKRVVADLESQSKGSPANPRNEYYTTGKWQAVPKSILNGPLIAGNLNPNQYR